MRFYLDTNVLIYVLMQEDDSISREVQRILDDYSNRFYVSSVVVRELIHAYKNGGIKDNDIKSVNDLFDAMDKSEIEIVPMNKHHLLQYAALDVVSGHKDPNDHIIIAQAISDKILIISSDRMFKEYVGQGLEFVFNRR
ncbi:MAG: type II toxin-antitoxin system VapC family toxin [Bacteroidales bacterium]|nr:type II toxin-antitoxin system VapC family toxin [Bacteroidales bacterium]